MRVGVRLVLEGDAKDGGQRGAKVADRPWAMIAWIRATCCLYMGAHPGMRDSTPDVSAVERHQRDAYPWAGCTYVREYDEPGAEEGGSAAVT